MLTSTFTTSFGAALASLFMLASAAPSGTSTALTPTSQCDTNANPDPIIIHFPNEPEAYYTYNVSCNTWFSAPLLSTLSVSSLTDCAQACMNWNEGGEHDDFCFSVGLMKIPDGLCYLNGLAEDGTTWGADTSSPVEGAHDSAGWIFE